MHATIRAGPRGPAAARPPPTRDNHPVRRRASSLPFRPAAKKPGFGDELLDFVLGKERGGGGVSVHWAVFACARERESSSSREARKNHPTTHPPT